MKVVVFPIQDSSREKIIESLKEIVARDRTSRNRLKKLLKEGDFLLFLSEEAFEKLEDARPYELYVDEVLSNRGILHWVMFWRLK